MVSEPLKPCPFCGGHAQYEFVELNPMHGYYAARCCDCGAESGYAKDKKEAAQKWNRREE